MPAATAAMQTGRVLELVACIGLLTLSSGCSDETLPADVEVRVQVGDEVASCGVSYALGSSGTPAELADVRFFLSEVEARHVDGLWSPLTLEDSNWQQDGLVLIDAEDAQGACADSGTAERNGFVRATLPVGSYDALRFDLGVPASDNHLDSATAPPPLNTAGMFWTWQSGYKFLRADVRLDHDGSRWNTHIGSAGCVSEAPTFAPTDACARPNRATITVEGLDPTTTGATLVMDLAALFADSDLHTNAPDSPPGCMNSAVESEDCEGVFGSLGLDVTSGDCIAGCAEQAVFR